MYVIYVIFLFMFIFTMSYIFSKSTHVHHYTISLIIMSLCGHHNFLITAVHAFFNGMYIEGSARWNQDPNWIMEEKYLNDDIKKWLPENIIKDAKRIYKELKITHI
jgi:hypothetical protein